MIKPDTRLGKLRIIRQIGKGGMADVYLAEDTVLGRNVAIKVLPPEMARDKDWLARFNREVRATANLFHPHIVTVYDVGEEDNIHFYLMEYLPNGDLKQRIDEGLSVVESLQYLKQIAKALKYAHNKGFIHRDIKPENILFDEDGNAKLTDLGIVTTLSSEATISNARESIGTPRYISPEQAQGDSLDERSDLYSLGIVFYEMLLGEVPYDADKPIAIALAHINEPIPQLPMELSPYQDFIEVLLAKSKEDRFASADELIEAIELLEVDQEFKLEEFYEKRREQQADVLNFGGISDTVEPSSRLWFWGIAIVLVGVVSLGYWQKDLVSENLSRSYDWAMALINSNTVDGDQPKGVIKIDSEPSGATVFLNGQEVGQTPYLGQSIRTGEHRLKLTHPLFSDASATIEVLDNKIVNKQLKLEVGTGSLLIESVPSGAWIELDGERLPETTPHKIDNLTTGVHHLLLGKEYLGQELAVEVHHGKVRSIKPQLVTGKMAFYPRDWIPIKNLYKKAQSLIDKNQLSSPTGNNAEEAYLAILKADPNQVSAEKKLIELGNMHWKLAQRAANRGDLATTEKHLSHSRRLLKDKYSYQSAKKLLETARRK